LVLNNGSSTTGFIIQEPFFREWQRFFNS
jgi:hypothetical protein